MYLFFQTVPSVHYPVFGLRKPEEIGGRSTVCKRKIPLDGSKARCELNADQAKLADIIGAIPKRSLFRSSD